MVNQTQDSEINKLSVRHGLLIGGIAVILYIIFYLIDPLLQYTNTMISLLSTVIVIALFVVLGLDVRKKIGGYWSFGEAYKSLIIMSVFVVLLYTICGFVMFKYVNPQLPEKVNSVMLDKMTETFTKLGLDQTKVDEATKPFQNGDFVARMQPTFKNELTNLGIGLLTYAIINLIVAACIKKKEPFITVPIEDQPAV
jgi:hypothetical protein